MGGKKRLLISLVCVLMILFGQTALAATEGGSAVAGPGDQKTDVYAGVSVDYMGKLQFHVTDRDTGAPIPGASVEIWIPSLNRYVLFGVTDANGILELDVAYGDGSGQFATNANGEWEFKGTLLYLNDNNILYRVYKAGWNPYPHEAGVELTTSRVPQVVEVKLYQEHPEQPEGGGGGGGGSDGGSGGNVTSPGPGPQTVQPPTGPLMPLEPIEETPAGGIPKTGVEGTMWYWIAGLLFFIIAGGITAYLLKNDKQIQDRKNKTIGGAQT